MITVQKTICPYDCPTACGLMAETDGTRILRICGDQDHPANQGIICEKMREYEASVHSAARLLTPMRRTGKKGEGKFEPISWEAAVGEITDRWKTILQEDGGDAILPLYYSGVMSVIQRKCGDAFFGRMGACTLVKTLCSSAKSAGYAAVMGKTGCLDPRELTDSDFLLIWSSNVKATRLQTMPMVLQARRDGKRVVLVEACAVDMAPYCDEVLLIHPGTDGALALAMMHVLEREHLADEAFLRKYAHGYEMFRKTLPAYSPAWAEKITRIPAAQIEALAKEYAAAKAPAILLGSGFSRMGNGGMTTRLITILSAYTGAWSRPGGGFCGCNPTGGDYIDDTLVTRPDFRRTPGRKVNINCLASALCGTQTERPVKSLYVYGSNPVGSVCNQTGLLQGLVREDLFTVVHERFLTDTARYADILLPATFSVEQTDCYTSYGYCTLATAKRLIEPAGESRSNWDTFRLLAQAMGYEEPYFRRTEEEVLQELLAHPAPGLKDISPEQRETLRRGGTISLPFADHLRFQTPAGKIMIVNEALPDPVPRYIPPYGGEFPLHLVAVPSCYTLNSIFLERDRLVEKRGAAILLLHPRDASARGIRDGDRVTAFNDLAEVPFQAQVTELVAAGSAAVPGIYTAADGGTLVNALHHERLSDMGAATTLNDNTIDVRKAD
ncbi:Anaerobic selenocysteine-containing dehydrogenase [Oscillibacter sp. PC13]|uniref:molybdopterin-containing oxidoreductase family protein n=1 Tax=Oscillibacter sp. PC13 TaxID=1855299 RepID=UPI0008E24C5B|nr:molybdopterin-dependent oxidoreductase [Oscillibacter sp. PC13]SFP22239.1 Anaerobic selenocysteine-containing dehydrogenase [Oscillibacter sp. PC13]